MSDYKSPIVVLNGPDNWKLWDYKFRFQVKILHLEKEIFHGVPPLEEPKLKAEFPVPPAILTIEDNPPARNMREASAANTPATKSQASTATTPADPFKTFDRQYKIWQMKHEVYLSYVFAYERELKQYDKQRDAFYKLLTWMEATICKEYRFLDCNPHDSFAGWYAKLKARAQGGRA
ncbi:hypothetical protein PRK78_003130 [Emydomyces testavorans]|uniref:Uncharacterized protein n=1 Tax=Emydomyces testavorans TaxID=2070801 RepID=A0AAF0DG89_9EURO|nr:hypothetical protein PRK78_003130 [Emydomyces testavorans]